MLTAYIARVLAVTAASVDKSTQKQMTPELNRALDYLAERIDEVDEPYLIASYALAALELGDSTRAARPLMKLQELAHQEQSGTYWALETNTPFYGWGLAGRIETTALAVQALARAKPTPESDRMLRSATLFLLKQKDRYGVWYSTQATINVLDALLVLLSVDNAGARKTEASSSAEILVNGKKLSSVILPSPARLTGPISVDLSQFVQAGANQVEIRQGSGGSTASVQAVATYYVPWPETQATENANSRSNGSSRLRLVAKFDKTEAKISEEITCHVEAERIGFRGYGMMLAEIGLPPGADVDRASLDKAMESDWGITQYDILPDRIIVYLLAARRRHQVRFQIQAAIWVKAQTAASLVYDYYNPEARAVVAPTRFLVK